MGCLLNYFLPFLCFTQKIIVATIVITPITAMPIVIRFWSEIPKPLVELESLLVAEAVIVIINVREIRNNKAKNFFIYISKIKSFLIYFSIIASKLQQKSKSNDLLFVRSKANFLPSTA